MPRFGDGYSGNRRCRRCGTSRPRTFSGKSTAYFAEFRFHGQIILARLDLKYRHHFSTFAYMTQDELKQAVARAAVEYVVDGEIVGVGTGSTANFFIDELSKIRSRI